MNIKEFLGTDKLAELNAQRMPEYWPMKEGPKVKDNSWDSIADAIIEASESVKGSVDEFIKAFNREEENG